MGSVTRLLGQNAFTCTDGTTDASAWTVLGYELRRGRTSWHETPETTTATVHMAPVGGPRRPSDAGPWRIDFNATGAARALGLTDTFQSSPRMAGLTPVTQKWDSRRQVATVTYQGPLARLSQVTPSAPTAYPAATVASRVSAWSTLAQQQIGVGIGTTEASTRTAWSLRAEAQASSDDVRTRLQRLGATLLADLWERRDGSLVLRAIDYSSMQEKWINGADRAGWDDDEWTLDPSTGATTMDVLAGSPASGYKTLSGRAPATTPVRVTYDGSALVNLADVDTTSRQLWELLDPTVWEPPTVRVDMLGIVRAFGTGGPWRLDDMANSVDVARWFTVGTELGANPPPNIYAKQQNIFAAGNNRLFVEGMREVLTPDSWDIWLYVSHNARYKLTPT